MLQASANGVKFLLQSSSQTYPHHTQKKSVSSLKHAPNIKIFCYGYPRSLREEKKKKRNRIGQHSKENSLKRGLGGCLTDDKNLNEFNQIDWFQRKESNVSPEFFSWPMAGNHKTSFSWINQTANKKGSQKKRVKIFLNFIYLHKTQRGQKTALNFPIFLT